MMQQASMDRNSAQVRAVLTDRLDLLAERLEGLASRSPHERLVSADIRRWQARGATCVIGGWRRWRHRRVTRSSRGSRRVSRLGQRCPQQQGGLCD